MRDVRRWWTRDRRTATDTQPAAPDAGDEVGDTDGADDRAPARRRRALETRLPREQRPRRSVRPSGDRGCFPDI
ncbi:hypothetical protein Acsp06_64870 [Actinomycetospora sp. NBRC 106375]|nr:hypothetical protein Acsp06_64870 [Actinomycetospora sp. NBRC 106375]